MICYAFATRHEGKDFVEALASKDEFVLGSLRCVIGVLQQRQVLVAYVGMGLDRSAANMEAVFQYFRPKAVVLSGYGGALVPQLKRKQVVMSNNYTTEEVLPFVRLLSGFDFGRFCSTDEVVSTPQRRAEYASATDCQIVDMETAPVAELVHGREIPFIAVRVISDEFQDPLPAGALAAGYDPETDEPCPFGLTGYLLTHPGQIGAFRKFASGLPAARKELTRFILELTEELPKGW
jgi:adenosylhomocysteine nucleosidase